MQVPKHDPINRKARVGPLLLPAGGRKGKTPRWPLPGHEDLFELNAWHQLWATPQAVAWERLGWTRTVGRYCRAMVRSEQPDASAAIMGQVVALEDRLGLSPKAMRLLLWTIASDEVGAKRDERATATARGRIKAVDPIEGSA